MSETDANTSVAVTIQPTLKVLTGEYSLFWPDDPPPVSETDYFRKVNQHGQAALCLSGGGIRSASFALGVLQALSKQGVLGKFHYVSSVSGGGYINSWLQRWLYSTRQSNLAVAFGAAAAKEAAPAYRTPAETVTEALRQDREPGEIKRLRENSNFITPRIGIASNDTWTAIAMSARNILTNWLLFGPLLLIVALFPNLFYHCLESIGPRARATEALFYLPLVIGGLGIGVACWNVVRALPSYRGDPPAGEGRGDNWHLLWIVLPFAVWAASGTINISAELLGAGAWPLPDALVSLGTKDWPFALGRPFMAATLAGMIGGFLLAGFTRPKYYRQTFARDILVALPAFLTAAFLLLLGPWLFDRFAPAADQAAEWRGIVLATVAPLWLIATQIVATIAFVAFRQPKHSLRARPDDDREWLARLSAIKLKLMLAWAAAAIAALLGNMLLAKFASGYDMSLSSLLAALTGAVALGGGRSSQTQSGAAAGSGGGGGKAAEKLFRLLPREMAITVATFLFAMLLLLLLARLEMRMIDPIAVRIAPVLPKWMDANVMAHWLLLAVLLIFLLVMIWRIDINRFSLNGMYRNRLARAFLGAARPERAPDPFTGFDAADNIRLHKLAEKPADEPACLYPVINVALNVTASENLAWQERKAEPFIFSPLYCGSILLDADPVRRHEDRQGAFIATADYGGRESDLAMEGTGVSLATAMSISGAAASPNMGYHSSAATAFLMTLFNVRLGAWMANPAVANEKRTRVRDSQPANALQALLSELAGSTDDRGRDIYLSDGGHFENLGLYEMLRRGCPFILVSDAGCDPDCGFADLGNAVRKAKIDLNVDIEFTTMKIRKRGDDKAGQLAYALGDITYPRRADESPRARRRKGQIVYLKPSYFDEEKLPRDVVSYAKLNGTFPHETTADQFFSESQFESYRKLGYTLALGLGARSARYDNVEDFFAAIERRLRSRG
jgi:hypothetical protein